MAIVNKALVETATGRVDNIIVYNDEGSWSPPSGFELVDVANLAEPGGSWDGAKFTAAPRRTPTRTDTLMLEVPEAKKFNADLFDGTLDSDGEITHDGMVDKTADERTAEKTELLNLLKATLTSGTDLSWTETQMMLRLERE